MNALPTTDWIAGKTVLITGGNTGIGKAAALALARRGAAVTIACRDATRADTARAEITAATGAPVGILPLDLAALDSVRGAAATFREQHDSLDVLVNNAGVAVFGRRRETADGLERQFGVNHLGHFLFTMLLADRITSRIVNVSSAAYGLARDGLRWHDLQWTGEYDGWQAYGASKLCNLYFTWELADRLRDRAVTVNALHPGYVDTDLGHRRPEDGAASRPPGARIGTVDLAALGTPLTPEQGARTTVMLATGMLGADLSTVTGAYFDDRQRRAEVSDIASDRAAAARLWTLSEELVAG